MEIKLADAIGEQSKEITEGIKYSEMVLGFGETRRLCRYSVQSSKMSMEWEPSHFCWRGDVRNSK